MFITQYKNGVMKCETVYLARWRYCYYPAVARITAPRRLRHGAPEAGKTALLESGAAALQSRPPIEAINTYLDGFHYYCGNQQGQMEAHHYVTILNDDVMQAVIYDGNKKTPN